MKTEDYLEQLEATVFRGDVNFEFPEKVKVAGGITIDTREGPLDHMASAHVVRVLFGSPLTARPNSVEGAALLFERNALVETGRSVARFAKLSLDSMAFRDSAIDILSKTIKHDPEIAKLACGLYSVSLEEKVSIPVLFLVHIANIPGYTIFYQFGVPDPWRFMITPPSLLVRGDIDLKSLPSNGGVSISCLDRVMWLSRKWNDGQRPASEPVYSGRSTPISHAMIISDHVPFDYKAVTTAERIRDAAK